MANILVFGATGFTGQKVARELDRRGAEYILAGRNPERLHRLAASLQGSPELRVAQAGEPESIDRALNGVTLVINTVGPFSDLGEEVVRCALARGVHYVDTTGEQAFIQSMEIKFDELARRQSVVLCCALAFEYALGECAAALAVQALEGRADLVETFYKTGKGGVSKGTAKSILRAVSSPMLAWKGGRMVSEAFAAVTTEVTLSGEKHYRLGVSFGGGSPLHMRHYGQVREARSFLVMNEDLIRKLTRYRHAASALKLGFAKKIADRIIDWKLPEDGPRTQDTSFHVTARARRAGLASQVCVSGKDPYQITAVIAVEGAMRIVAGECKKAGAYAVPSILDPATFLDALKEAGTTWSMSHG